MYRISGKIQYPVQNDISYYQVKKIEPVHP